MTKLNWYINRLSLMSPLEIGYRIKKEMKKNVGRIVVKDIKEKVFLSDKEVNWHINLTDREKIPSFVREKGLWNEEKAKLLLEHRFSFFSFDKKYLGKAVDWHKDYKNQKQAPTTYSKNINYRDFAEVGDIKYIWEINRHQHLIVLAKAYYLTGNTQYRDEVIEQIKSWIQANPFMKGVNWESSLELAIRLISWSWIWFFLGDLDSEFKEKWVECIYKHCRFISKNFSRYSSANNHLIGEAAGLFVASIVWPFDKEAKKWKKKSYDILVEELEKQNYKDGVNKEQAISYQQFVLDFFILAGLLGEKNGVDFPEEYWGQIEQILVFIASIMDKNGNIPNIGDSDDGFAVTLSDVEDFNPYQSLLATGAVLFKRADFKSKAGRFDEKSLWLLGIDGMEQFKVLEEKKFTPAKSFEKGGYYILSANEGTNDEIKATFDCGPLGYLSLAAHGHADALSFTLNVGGREVIIDPGTYAYHTQKEWREYFRGTSAHNTVRVDKQNQSVSGGAFMWLNKAQAKVLKWESKDDHDTLIGEHDGYTRLKAPVKHKREVFFDKKGKVFKITDRIEARKRHYIEQFFHFSSECEIIQLSQKEWQIKNNNIIVEMKVDKKVSTEIVKGNVKPISGWQSRRFDVKEKSSTMVNCMECDGFCELETVITIKGAGE